MIRTDLLSFLLFIHYRTIRREKRGGSGRDVGGGGGSGGGLKGRGDAAALRKIGGSERECGGCGGVSVSGGGIA